MLPEHHRQSRERSRHSDVKSSYKEEITLPSLLWRIDEAEQSRYSRGASLAVYRADVLRNLRWLLNASSARESESIWNFTRASTSVVNFGIPPYSGRIGTHINADQMADAIHQCILQYEPRILPETLHVEKVAMEDGEGNVTIAFRITGSIWSQPVPERFSLETTVDTSSGEWTFSG